MRSPQAGAKWMRMFKKEQFLLIFLIVKQLHELRYVSNMDAMMIV